MYSVVRPAPGQLSLSIPHKSRANLRSDFLPSSGSGCSSISKIQKVSSKSRWCMALPPRKGALVLAPYQDKFIPWLDAAARTQEGKEQLEAAAAGELDFPPLLDIAAAQQAKWSMTAPAQVDRGGGYGEHKPRRPPPDLPSLLLNSRIVYIGMPVMSFSMLTTFVV